MYGATEFAVAAPECTSGAHAPSPAMKARVLGVSTVAARQMPAVVGTDFVKPMSSPFRVALAAAVVTGEVTYGDTSAIACHTKTSSAPCVGRAPEESEPIRMYAGVVLANVDEQRRHSVETYGHAVQPVPGVPPVPHVQMSMEPDPEKPRTYALTVHVTLEQAATPWYFMEYWVAAVAGTCTRSAVSVPSGAVPAFAVTVGFPVPRALESHAALSISMLRGIALVAADSQRTPNVPLESSTRAVSDDVHSTKSPF